MIDAALRDSWQELTHRLGAYVARRVPPQDADDVVQDVLLRIHQSVRSLSDDSRFGPWVYSVARNAVIDRLRRVRANRIESIDPEGLVAPDEQEDEQVLLRCVTPFVTRLPEAYRHALTLVELQGLTHAEAAAVAGISVSGMKSRVQRGRRLLRQSFEDCCALTVDGRGRVINAERHEQSTCQSACEPSCEDDKRHVS